MATARGQPRLRPGKLLGNYAIERLLGRGATSDVYEASHTILGRRVALKVLSDERANAADSLSRFFREARTAAAVRHPHVVDVFDVGIDDGVFFLVMELVVGETLAKYCRREGALDVKTVADLLLPVVAAVRALHGGKILHRDLKPSNILLAEDRPVRPHPMVTDLGIARCERDQGLTASDMLLGTLAYLAPELISTPRDASEASDQYALGVILYECSTGRRPFAGDTNYALMHAIATTNPSAPSTHNRALPPAWDALVLRAMSRVPAERFESLERLETELATVGGTRRPDPVPAIVQPLPRNRRRRLQFFAGTAGVSGLLLVGGSVVAAAGAVRREPESSVQSSPAASLACPVAPQEPRSPTDHEASARELPSTSAASAPAGQDTIARSFPGGPPPAHASASPAWEPPRLPHNARDRERRPSTDSSGRTDHPIAPTGFVTGAPTDAPILELDR